MGPLQIFLFGTFICYVGGDDCSNRAPNATGSITIPGPRINESFGESPWTLSSLIFESTNPDPPYVSNVQRIFELETALPLQNFSDPAYPFTGCLFFFTASELSPVNDDGTCSSTISSTCLAQLITIVNNTASAISGGPNSTSLDACVNIGPSLTALNDPAFNCSFFVHTHDPFVSLSSLPGAHIPTVDPNCPANNVKGTNASQIYSNGPLSSGNEEGNYVGYDVALISPTPIVVTRWVKEGNGIVGWADTRVVCVTPDKVAAGSRQFNETELDAAVSSAISSLGAEPTSTSTFAPSQTSSAASSSKTASGGVRTFGAGASVAFVVTLVFGLAL